ncbi:ankyrin repeat, SAM and basic leucine zipper domain-containing protein 1 [Uranotaenia lowii]|uniref:ankyrin repeat, SAM and basic leucine zipper domain-containing protein 1 n=1 Tax=Uranotaenia lowii TaxID=190385 RepID=UPI0024790FEE|nr:ankyrin repeat, SAM and basic leucine zipper domain-containing protein 1 [Uranotaenia lowii]
MFCPAGYYSDSDEDSEYGYSFGYSKDKQQPSKQTSEAPFQPPENNDDLLFKAVQEGNLPEMCRVLERDRYLLTGCLRYGWPLLLLACNEAKCEIVRYLLEEKRLDVNQPYGLKTALMAACESKAEYNDVLSMVELLLEFGAIINCRDSHGMTPLMFAVIGGHTEVVRLILDQASIEATDNEGLTALFHAVTNRRPEIVQMLLKAGAATDIVNRRGFTPKQEAQFRAYTEIVELFPVEKDLFIIPRRYLHYGTYKDICWAEENGEQSLPGYQQEIGLLLYGMYSEQHLGLFAKENVDLERFLTYTDQDLSDLGFHLPFERKKILHGLLKFHRQAWNKRSMKRFRKDTLDSYDLLELMANHLKQVTVMQSSLVFIANFLPPETIQAKFEPQLSECLRKVKRLRQTVSSLEEEFERINNITVMRPVMHIDAKCIPQRSSTLVCWCVRLAKLALVSGLVGVFVYRKLKH